MKKLFFLLVVMLAVSANSFALKFPVSYYHTNEQWGMIQSKKTKDSVIVKYRSYVVHFKSIESLVKSGYIKKSLVKKYESDLTEGSYVLFKHFKSDIYDYAPSYEVIESKAYTFEYEFPITSKVKKRETRLLGIDEDRFNYNSVSPSQTRKIEKKLKEYCLAHGFLLKTESLGDPETSLYRDYRQIFRIYKRAMKKFTATLVLKIIEESESFDDIYFTDILISMAQFVGVIRYLQPPLYAWGDAGLVYTGEYWTPLKMLIEGAGDCDSKNILFAVMLSIFQDIVLTMKDDGSPMVKKIKKEMKDFKFKLLMFPARKNEKTGHIFTIVKLPFDQIYPTVRYEGDTYSVVDVTQEYIPGFETEWEQRYPESIIIEFD